MNSQLLKAKIVEKGKTQETVAKEIHISPMSLSRKITGKREFTLSEVVNLCKCLNIDNPQDIFFAELSHICNDSGKTV